MEPTDIVFVIGAAGNGAENIYNKNKKIVSKYIEANKVPNTMYSIVDYGPKAVVRSKFGENKQRAILLDHIENLQHPGDGKALDKVGKLCVHVYPLMNPNIHSMPLLVSKYDLLTFL